MEKTERMTVTIPKDIRAMVVEQAKQEDRSVSNMVTVLIQRGMKWIKPNA